MATAINIYPRGGTDYSNFFSDVCPVCSKVHHIYNPNPFMCYAAGMPGTAMTPTVIATDLPGSTFGDICSNATLFCAVGPNTAVTSANGTTWTRRTIGPGIWEGIAYNGVNLFVAVGLDCFASSADGITWTVRSGPPGYWTSVAWNGTVFCAVSMDGKCCTSADGTTWTSRTIPFGQWKSVSFSTALSLFCAIGGGIPLSGGSGFATCATSADGITWTDRTASATNPTGFPVTGLYNDVVASNGSLFVAVGNGVQIKSADGIVWVAATTQVAGNFRSVAWNAGTDTLFAAVGPSCAASSPDGVTWTLRTIPAGPYIADWWLAGVGFAAVGAEIAALSTNGTANYAAETLPTSPLATLQAGTVVES